MGRNLCPSRNLGRDTLWSDVSAGIPHEIKGLRGHGKSFGGPTGQGFREQHLLCEIQQLFSQQWCKGWKQTASPWSAGRSPEVPACRGSWAGTELQDGPCGCPWSTDPCGAAAARHPSRQAGDIRAPASPPRRVTGTESGPSRPAVTVPGRWPWGLAANSSPERRPGQPGVDQRGFAGCPSGIIGTQGQKSGFLPAGTASRAEPCPGGLLGAVSAGMCSYLGGEGSPSRGRAGARGGPGPRGPGSPGVAGLPAGSRRACAGRNVCSGRSSPGAISGPKRPRGRALYQG